MCVYSANVIDTKETKMPRVHITVQSLYTCKINITRWYVLTTHSTLLPDTPSFNAFLYPSNAMANSSSPRHCCIIDPVPTVYCPYALVKQHDLRETGRTISMAMAYLSNILLGTRKPVSCESESGSRYVERGSRFTEGCSERRSGLEAVSFGCSTIGEESIVCLELESMCLVSSGVHVGVCIVGCT